jgi:ATP phosphoribosyltransferase regulatory subunit HisZ
MAAIDPDRIDACAAMIRARFAPLAKRRVQTAPVQDLLPYLDFLGEGYRARLIPFEVSAESCLRADYTLSVALDIIAGKLTPEPLWYDDYVFRGDYKQTAVEAVHREVGVEVFAEKNALDAESDLIAASLAAARDAGVANVALRFADIGLMHAVIDALALNDNRKSALKRSFATPTAFHRAIDDAKNKDQLDLPEGYDWAGLSDEAAEAAVLNILEQAGTPAIGERTPAEIAQRLVLKAREAKTGLADHQAKILHDLANVVAPIEQALPRIAALAAQLGVDVSAHVARWRERITNLSAHGVDASEAIFDANLGRGLSYYDGMVFELSDAKSGAWLGGGGRYDSLLARLSGGVAHASALGAMLRPDRLAEAGRL